MYCPAVFRATGVVPGMTNLGPLLHMLILGLFGVCPKILEQIHFFLSNYFRYELCIL